MTRRTLLSVSAVIALAIGGWFVMGLFAEHVGGNTSGDAAGSATEAGNDGAADGSGPSTTPAPATSPVAVPVEAARARRGELVKRITATGTAEAVRKVRLQAQVGAPVLSVPVEEGEPVEAGAPLVELDDRELRLEQERARERVTEALARLAEQEYLAGADDAAAEDVDPEALEEFREAERGFLQGLIPEATFRALVNDPGLEELFADISREEVISSRLRLVDARVALEQAALAVERARVHAPFEGQIAELDVVEGQHVQAGTELMTLVDADPIRVRTGVLESESGMVRQGRHATVRFAAYPNDPVAGRVELVSPLVDPETRTLEVVVSLPNPQLRYKPGMFARVELDAQIFDDRLLVPAAAVLIRDDRPLVFAVDAESRAQWVYVQTGLENPEWIEILDGIQVGDLVITSGHFSLAHDSPVRVANAEELGLES